MSGERKPAFPAIALWGAFLAALTAVSVIAFDPDVSTPALLGGAAAFVLLAALALAFSRLSLQSDGGGADPGTSPATAWLTASLCLALLGAAIGPWLTLIGAGMAAAGIAALVGELRAQRRARRDEEAER